MVDNYDEIYNERKGFKVNGMAAINKKATLSTLTRLYFQIDKNGILKVLGTDMEHWAAIMQQKSVRK